MDETLITQLSASAQQLATAAAALETALTQFNAQHEALNAKIDRIVAAIDDRASDAESVPHICPGLADVGLKERVAELERANQELKAQAARASRKTLPPLVTAILAKNEIGDGFDSAALDRALTTLSVDQRIAVKAEMARAGLIE